MSTINRYACQEDFELIKSQMRTTLQTAFYHNNVENVKTVAYAYERARQSPGTVTLTGIPVFEAEKQGLPENAYALLFNDGNTFGRAAAARKILGQEGVDLVKLSAIIRDAIYDARTKKCITEK